MTKKAKTEHEQRENKTKIPLDEEQPESSQRGSESELCEEDAIGAQDAQDAGDAQAVQGESREEDEELQTKYVRLAADFQNFRRRTENEKKEIYAYANENLVKDMLNVMDNFERAVDQAKDSGDQGFADGIVLIYKQFKSVLENFGTQEIPAQGEEFDPNVHHAVMMDSGTQCESGKITEVLQKGYTLNGRVIRPSMVKVAE